MAQRLRVTGITLDDAPTPQRLRVAGITLTGSAPTAQRLRVAGITLTGTVAVGITLTASVTDLNHLEPYDTITLTANTPTGYPTPSGYTWTSSTVTLTGSGATRTFVVPRALVPTPFTVSVYASLSGANSPTQTLTMLAPPHLNWRFDASNALFPVHRTRP